VGVDPDDVTTLQIGELLDPGGVLGEERGVIGDLAAAGATELDRGEAGGLELDRDPRRRPDHLSVTGLHQLLQRGIRGEHAWAHRARERPLELTAYRSEMGLGAR
jgi:hypothetical protein